MISTSTSGEVRPEHDRSVGSDLVLLHYVRGFALPIVDLWAYLTEADRLAPWFGTMTGDPFSGDVQVRAEDDCRTETVAVHVDKCTSPHLLDLAFDDGNIIEVKLDQVGVVTTLELVRRHLHPSELATVGPHWQYYLDRLEATIARVDLPVWSDYASLAAEYVAPA